GTPRALKTEVGGGRLELTLVSPRDRGRAAQFLSGRPGVTRIASGGPLTVYVDDPKVSTAVLLRDLEAEGMSVAAVEQAQATLDDVFLRYTGERPRAEARVEGAVSSMFKAVHGKRRH
ncbi:MAG: DUF4162 domain-containing protein, partial [Acidimicrobiaceae bacterium]|nr:DUF4162 domain-containing protein [Acidimicrobiaceae bacterium]